MPVSLAQRISMAGMMPKFYNQQSLLYYQCLLTEMQLLASSEDFKHMFGNCRDVPIHPRLIDVSQCNRLKSCIFSSISPLENFKLYSLDIRTGFIEKLTSIFNLDSKLSTVFSTIKDPISF
jgi:hypothetical protein